MVSAIDVRIPVDGEIELGARLFVPEGKEPRPAITMAHGFAGTQAHGLERFAAAFAAAGFVVLVHDHRNFGTSGGALRGDIDPWRQIADWRRAITYLESRPEVDPTRIGLWGTSYAGGHAIVLGATDRRLRCVVAQVPTISGYEQGRRRVSPDSLSALEAAFDEDERAQLRGEQPRRQAVVSADANVSAPIVPRMPLISTCSLHRWDYGKTKSRFAPPGPHACTNLAPGSRACRPRRCFLSLLGTTR